MFNLLKWSLVAILTTATLPYARETRQLRAISDHPPKSASQPRTLGADEEVLLSYEGRLVYIATIPNDYGEKYYNVRFTPPFAPFYLLGAYIALFDMNGQCGTPGMRVIVWQSDEDGLPSEFIDSLDVAYEDLVFSNADRAIYSFIDLTPLEISFFDEIEFHIGVDIIADEEEDTLAVFVDNADGERENRGSLWSDAEGRWMTMEDVFNNDYCFAIRALVTDENPFTKGALAGTVLDLSNDEPIPGALVVISRGDSALCDDGGEFIFRRLSVADGYSLTASADGYNDLYWAGENGDGFAIAENETLWVELRLPHPEFTLDHEGFDFNLAQDSTGMEYFTITNLGNGPLWFNSGFTSSENGADEPWNRLLSWNASEPVEDPYLHAIEYIGDRWLVTGDANLDETNWFYIFDSEGQYVDRLLQPVEGRRGIRDMKFYNGSLYCALNETYLLKVNPETGEEISRINIPLHNLRVNSVAVDPSTGEFYVSGITGGVHRLESAGDDSLAGMEDYPIADPRTNESVWIYGLAWQPDESDGFNLIILSPATTEYDSGSADVSFFKLNPGTGEVRLLLNSLQFGEDDNGTGGLCFTESWDRNRLVLAAVIDNPSGDRVEVIEVAPNSKWVSYNPRADTLEAQGSAPIELTVDCTALDTGYYRIAIKFFHNAAGGVAYLPIELNVTPALSIPPSSDFIPYPSSLILSVFPNPFNSSTTIRFSLPTPGPVHLEVYDPLGRRVRELIPGSWMSAGEYRLSWNAAGIPSGKYLIRAQAGDWSREEPAVKIK